ncbi:MAG: zinc ribbon domain-containing protein [Candidatus Lokiarchaeota archaeon]|nr:zinc ribbon domain-containing protein [Candidatus Lokiarchaeota archaeon]
MYKRKGPGDYIWIFPLIGVICITIALLTPTASYNSMGISWSWWMWDFSLLTYVGYPPITFFEIELDFIIISIITTSATLLNIVNLSILTSKTKKKGFDTKNFGLMSTFSALLSMGVMIYYAVAISLAFIDGLLIEGVTFPPGFHFWLEFSPSFGMVLPFISAIVLFVGIGLFRKYSKHRGDYIAFGSSNVPRNDIVPSKTDVATRYNPPSTAMKILNYCPECGNKVLRADTKFCTNCGFKF